MRNRRAGDQTQSITIHILIMSIKLSIQNRIVKITMSLAAWRHSNALCCAPFMMQFSSTQYPLFVPLYHCIYIFANSASICWSKNALFSPVNSVCNRCSTKARTCFFVTLSRSTSVRQLRTASMIAPSSGPLCVPRKSTVLTGLLPNPSGLRFCGTVGDCIAIRLSVLGMLILWYGWL